MSLDISVCLNFTLKQNLLVQKGEVSVWTQICELIRINILFINIGISLFVLFVTAHDDKATLLNHKQN